MADAEQRILSKLVADLVASLPDGYWDWVDSLNIKVLQVAK